MEFLPIDKQEVLRYLGYSGQELDDKLDDMINESISKCYKIASPRYCCRTFDCSAEEQGIFLHGTGLALKGDDIYKHLLHARRVAILAATLGVAFDNHVRILEQVSMTEALVMDACGTEYIEKVCDTIEKEIAQSAHKEGYNTNFRFSPGYGDFPLGQQREITGLLDTSRKIGLTCTPELVMLPRKSVTAVIGFLPGEQAAEPASKCETCAINETCQFKREGKACGRYKLFKKQYTGV